ncbi:hypothetical protein D3C73_617920 [compost metagenome]
MQYGYCNKCGNIEPNSDIHVTFASFDNSTEHIDSEYDPNEGNCDINRPFHFGILMA